MSSRATPAPVPRAPRYRFAALTAVADSGTEFFAARIRDASASGCFLETELPCVVGDSIRVFPIHTDGRLPVELPGRVVRVHQSELGGLGLAVEFARLSTHETERLHTFVVAQGTRCG